MPRIIIICPKFFLLCLKTCVVSRNIIFISQHLTLNQNEVLLGIHVSTFGWSINQALDVDEIYTVDIDASFLCPEDYMCYLQPMISYCIGRSAGARRKVVDIPDRIMSNYDKRS